MTKHHRDDLSLTNIRGTIFGFPDEGDVWSEIDHWLVGTKVDLGTSYAIKIVLDDGTHREGQLADADHCAPMRWTAAPKAAILIV